MRNRLAKCMFMMCLPCGFLFCVGTNESMAFEKEGYNTPDSYSRQVSPGQMQESYNGTALTGDTKIYATLTTRYRLRTNSYSSDNDLYQYLRARTDSIKIGQGTVKLSAYARFASDLDRDRGIGASDEFYFFRDSLDAQLHRNNMAPRLYQANASFDGVIKNTVVNLGRFDLMHMNAFLLDGADVNVTLGDAMSVYAFGGRPVSFYYRQADDNLAGGGVSYKVAKHTKMGAEYVRLQVKGGANDFTKIRLDQGIPGGNVSVGFTMLDDAGTVYIEGANEIASTGTILTGKFESLLRDVNSSNNYVVNPLTNVLAHHSRYNKYEIGAYQAFLKHFAAGVTYTQRVVSGAENLDNRSYSKIGGKFDIIGLPSENTYISLSADYWGVKGNTVSSRNESVQYGLQINQKITKTVDVWGGTSYNRYDYNTNPNINREKRMDWARTFYLGSQYKPNKHLCFSADLSMEHGSFYNEVSNDLNTNYKSEIWVSILF